MRDALDQPLHRITIKVDSPSKLPSDVATSYGIPQNYDHLRFFSGDESQYHEYTPPILQFSTTPLSAEEPAPPPTPWEEDMRLLTNELRSLIPDDFRLQRHRRRLSEQRAMVNLSPALRQRINKQKQQQEQQVDDDMTLDDTFPPNDAETLKLDTVAYIRRLLREVDVETSQTPALKKALCEGDLIAARRTLKWKRRMEIEEAENRRLRQQHASSSSSSRLTQYSENGTLNDAGFLDVFE